MCLLVVSPEIEVRDEVKVGNWAKHKKTYCLKILRVILKFTRRALVWNATRLEDMLRIATSFSK
jgi:hypothetical protein